MEDTSDKHRMLDNHGKEDEFMTNSKSSVTDEEKIEVIKEFQKIPQCSIMKYGIKPSTETIPFGYCGTCDVNLIHPICMECIDKCHIGHTIKNHGRYAKIICGCGERMHKFQTSRKNEKSEFTLCPFTEWCRVSGIPTVYMIGTKTVCFLCYILCKFDGGFAFTPDEGMDSTCQCDEIQGGNSHQDLKAIYSKMDILFNDKCILMKQLGPIKILNLFFLGKLSYELLYSNFDEMLNDFRKLKSIGEYEIQDNFIETNFFLILKNFTAIAGKIKNTPIRYFVTELCDRLSFDFLKQVITCIQYKESRAFWSFLDRLLFLYKKVVIGNKTQTMDKYKLYDFENLSFIQRFCICHSNKNKIFSDSQQQITFFIETLAVYLNSTITLVEGYDIIIQICAILKRMSEFYLFSPKDMILFCLQFERCFDFIKKFKNFHKQLQLFRIVIKMFHWFIYNYNDEIFYEYLKENDLTENDDFKLYFFFSKNELGRLISRNVIRMMYFCTENIDKDLTANEKKDVQKILEHGMTIFSFLVSSKDSYLINLNKVTKKCTEYYELIKMKENAEYNEILALQTKLEMYFQEYFTFIINQDELIQNTKEILDIIMNKQKYRNHQSYLLKSNFYFSIIKIFHIIIFSYDNEQHKDLIEEIFNFIRYFIDDHSDNALLILSHYYLVALMKLPYEYANDNLNLWSQCCTLVSKTDGVIVYPKEILKNMCVYLIDLKGKYEDKPSEMNALINLYLTILSKLVIETKSLNEDVTLTVSKQIIMKLLYVFKFEFFETTNVCLLLVLTNSIFDSSNCYDRKQLLDLIPLETLMNELENLTIDLEYRMEILNFVKKNKYNIYFEEESDDDESQSSESLNETMHDYLNAFIHKSDNFLEIKNSPLISNYQYPSKYLSFYFDLIKMNHLKDSNSNQKLTFDREPIDLYIKEISKIKNLYLLHSTDTYVFIDYLAKAIFDPLISIVRKTFCFTHQFNGKQILLLYNLAMTILYLKKWIFSLDQEYKDIFNNMNEYNFKLFACEEHRKDCILDFNDLKEKIKSSPFDYTYLYIIFQRHLFCFVNYPKSSKLTVEFATNHTGYEEKTKYVNQTMMSNNSEILNPLVIEKNTKTLFFTYQSLKNDITEENSSLFISLNEMCIENEKNFRSLLISILITLALESEQFESDCYLILFKLLSIETGETQNDVMDYFKMQKKTEFNFLLDFSAKLYQIIVKIFINDFTNERQNDKSLQMTSFNLIKLFKYLCEEHNNFFQSRILLKLGYDFNQWKHDTNRYFSSEEEERPKMTSMTFFNFLLNVIIKILLITNKARKESHMGFMYDLFFSLIELLIEIVQGNKEDIIVNKVKKTKKELMNNEKTLATFKEFAQISSEILFDDLLINEYSFKVKLQLMSFFIAILEEKTNDSIQKIIMKFLTLNKVLTSIIFTLKSYFYKNTRNNPSYTKYYSDYSDEQIFSQKFKFDFNLFEFFKNEYFQTDFSKKSEEFLLANNYYRYIKILSINDKSLEASNIIKQIEAISESESKKRFMVNKKQIIKSNEVVPINLINEKEKSINMEFIEHFFIIKFFELITQVIEIRISEEKRNQLVIFTIPSEMIYLSEMTKVEFLNNVDRESETSKKSELLENISLFQKEIKYFKKTNLNWFIRFVIRLDYVYVQIAVYLYVLIFNVLMIFTLSGYTQKDSLARNLYEIDVKYTDSIDLSIDEWGIVLDTLTYILVILIGFLILSWIFIKMPLYYRLDKIKYIKENNLQSKKQLSFWNKTYIAIIMSIYNRDYINSLLYMFLVAMIGAIMKRGEIVYPFLLIAIINLNPTLKNIIVAIKMRYMELISAFLLMLIMIYFYSNMGFFFFNENFERVVEGVDDNLCKSLVFCFLTLVDAGVRARGGAGDQMIRISFERNVVNYSERLAYDVTYFLLVIILMIDLVFGIIIGTFSEMRQEEIKHAIDKENHCFICHVTRELVEQQREDFTIHREVSHNLWNYVNYMIFLKFSKMQDLNASNSYAKELLEQCNICFLPTYKTSYIRHEKVEEENPINEEENDDNSSSEDDSMQEKPEEYEEENKTKQDTKNNNNTSPQAKYKKT